MAGAGALPGDKGQNPLPGELDGLAGGQILGHQQEGTLGKPEPGIAAEDVVNPPGHIPDIRAAGIHVLVIHGRKDLGELLAGVQRRDGCRRAALNGSGHSVQVVQVLQHEHLDLHNGGLLLAQLHLGLLVEGAQLLPGGFPGRVKLCLLHLGVAGGNRQCPLGFPVDHGRSDGYAGEYRQSKTSFHVSHLTFPAQ